MKSYDKLLLQNKAWAQEKGIEDITFFSRLAKQQNPEFLWIGCSDSRVPANEITGTDPGEIFVHRNIANLVIDTDLNLLSVLQYAVEALEVKHIIVCGHYGCGGVRAALSPVYLGLINKWIRKIQHVYVAHEDELKGIEHMDRKVDRLVELNVLTQCRDLAKTSIVQKSWHKRQYPYIHGWVYDIHDGLIRDLLQLVPGEADIHPIYKFDTNSWT
ncbi:MAG: carbonic anhydrase [Bacteroidetes bacterium]|jgi:carbonic anhydrase|nr:carbonic anhydrase [Bacteroidota bacterium]